MDHELLMQDMVTGYRTYAEPADLDLDVAATAEAPATTPVCASFLGSFALSYVTTNGPG